MKLFRRTTTSPEETLAATLGDYELPTFPSVAIHALDLLAAQADLDEVVDVVAVDPGLSVRVLHIVNSPAFAPRMPISSMHRAAVMLGRTRLESVLITSAVSQSLPTTAMSDAAMAEFWRRAAIRASAAALMASRFDLANRSEHFTAALLQDMAQPVLACVHDFYGDLWDRCHTNQLELMAGEVEHLGLSHVDIGVAMSQRWEFPEKLTSLMAGHHDEIDGDASVGHRIAHWTSTIDTPARDHLADTALDWFGLEADEVERLLDDAEEQAAGLTAMFR